MVFAKHLKYGRFIENIMLFFFISKTLKQINKTPVECSRECRECVLPWRVYFFLHYKRINFATKQLKLFKKSQRSKKKWLCNKQILIRCNEKLNLSVEKYWQEKMKGFQNIKCIPLGHTLRFHSFIMVAEIGWVTRFWRSRNTLYVSVKDEHFFLFI